MPSLYAGWGAVLCRNVPHSIVKVSYFYVRFSFCARERNLSQQKTCGGRESIRHVLLLCLYCGFIQLPTVIFIGLILAFCISTVVLHIRKLEAIYAVSKRSWCPTHHITNSLFPSSMPNIFSFNYNLPSCNWLS